MDKVKNKPLKILLTLFLILLSYYCDWPLLAPVFTLLFVWAQKSEHRLRVAFFLCALLYGVYVFSFYITLYSYWNSLGYAVSAMAGVPLGGLCILFLYSGGFVKPAFSFCNLSEHFDFPLVMC